MRKAKAQLKTRSAFFTVAIPLSVFEALEQQADVQGLKWRQLAQKHIISATEKAASSKELAA